MAATMTLGFLGFATALALLAHSPVVEAITAVSTTNASELVANLLSLNGAVILNATRIGGNTCAGLFSGGSSIDPTNTSLIPDTGVILSSGDVAGVSGPNDSDGFSTAFGLGGDPDLDALNPGFSTFDACILEIVFECPAGIQGSNVVFNYIFASDEYNEYVGSSYNDLFGWFLNGVNIATIPNTTNTPVAINNVNGGAYPEFFRNNDISDFGTPTPYDIEADGFTATFTASGPTVVGPNTLKLAIADAGDYVLDSWVLIEAGSFTCTTVGCNGTKYYIWDSATDTEVGELTPGFVGCIAQPFNFEARFCTPPETFPLVLKLSGTNYTARGKEFDAPYFLFGDNNGDVLNNPKNKPLVNGDYTLYSTVDGITSTVSFTQACP